MTQMAMIIDLDRCSDTRACSMACKQENDVVLGSFWNQVFTVTTGEFPETETYFLPVICQHCGNPPCVPACPSAAFRKRADGIVVVDKYKCTGCDEKLCMNACPYDVIFFNKAENVAEKCDLCAHLVDEGIEPACSFYCNTRARIVGDIDDPGSAISEALRVAGDAVFHLKPELGTEPSVAYVLHGKEWHDMSNLRVR